MILSAKKQPDLPSEQNCASQAVKWHQDCLSTTILLASSFGQKSMKKLLKQASFQQEAIPAKPESLLGSLHQACHQDPGVRAAVAKALNAKYQATISQTKKLSREQLFEKAKQSPWLAPLLWACFGHHDQKIQEAGLELSHLIMLQAMKQLRGQDLMDPLKKQTEGLGKQNQSLRNELVAMQKENKRLAQSLKRLPQRLKAKPAPQPHPNSSRKRELKKLRRELAEQKTEADNLRQELAVWRSLAFRPEPGHQPESQAELKREFAIQSVEDLSGCQDCPIRNCPNSGSCPLKGKKIAVIGGLDRLEKKYCEAVEKAGAECLCHTGRISSGARKLKQLVNKSDLVLYLTPINSHGAMSVVKKHCKQCKKPFCPLNGVGVSALESHLKNADIFF